MSRNKITRIIIQPKDIQNITGRSYRTAVRLYDNIRKHFSKAKYQFISLREFCLYTGLEEDLVREYMNS